MNCEKCGVSDERFPLFDVVLGEKIVQRCKRCAQIDDLLIIKPASGELGIPPERHQSVYERMTKISGVKRDLSQVKKVDKREVFGTTVEPSLRDLVEKNLEKKREEEKNKDDKVMRRNDLVENYHWVVMRARRAKKITHEQLAEKIAEPALVLARLERGLLPEKDVVLRKVERALGIRLFKLKEGEKDEYFSSMVSEDLLNSVSKSGLELSPEDADALKIADLKKLEKEQGKEKKSYWERFKRKKKKEEKAEEVKIEVEEKKEEKKKESKVDEAEEEKAEEKPKKASLFERLFLRKKPEYSEEEEINVEDKEEVKEEKKEEKKDKKKDILKKKDLTPEEINEVIFGRKENKK